MLYFDSKFNARVIRLILILSSKYFFIKSVYSIYFLCLREIDFSLNDYMRNKKDMYHTVGTVPNSNRQSKKSAKSIHKYTTAHFAGFGIGTSIISDVTDFKLVLWTQIIIINSVCSFDSRQTFSGWIWFLVEYIYIYFIFLDNHESCFVVYDHHPSDMLCNRIYISLSITVPVDIPGNQYSWRDIWSIRSTIRISL
jgi:hypothetical protein